MLDDSANNAPSPFVSSTVLAGLATALPVSMATPLFTVIFCFAATIISGFLMTSLALLSKLTVSALVAIFVVPFSLLRLPPNKILSAFKLFKLAAVNCKLLASVMS